MLHTEIMNLTYAVNDNSIKRENYAKDFVKSFNKKIANKNNNLSEMNTMCKYAMEKGYETNQWWDENEYTKLLYLMYTQYCKKVDIK